MSEPGDPDYEECLPPGLVKPAEVIGVSNGHSWISYGGRGSGSSAIICCCHCGIVRRSDDQNKPCRGVVMVGLRGGVVGPAQRPQETTHD